MATTELPNVRILKSTTPAETQVLIGLGTNDKNSSANLSNRWCQKVDLYVQQVAVPSTIQERLQMTREYVNKSQTFEELSTALRTRSNYTAIATYILR